MKFKVARLRQAVLMASMCASPAAFADTAFADPVPIDVQFILQWTPPVLNDDGSPLTDLIGYYIYAGDSPDDMQPVWFINSAFSSCMLSSPTPGVYYISVSAVNADGVESVLPGSIAQTVVAASQ